MSSSNPLQQNAWLGIAGGVGLLGLAALVIAFQWQTHTTISLDNPNSSAPQKQGYTMYTEKQENGLGGADYHYYLLDRDTGRIWKKDKYGDSWKEVKVESLTPSESPAASR